MNRPARPMLLAAAALVLGLPAATFAQSSPLPVLTPEPSAQPTAAPASSDGTATGARRSSLPGIRSTNVSGFPSGAKVKAIKYASLSRSQVVYGLTHQLAAAKQLAQMKTIAFDNLRVYRLPTSLKSMFRLSDAETERIAYVMFQGIEVAQTTPALPSGGNNSPIQYLRDVLANITVSNALDASNGNANVALRHVLDENKISIGRVVGLSIGGGGIITTIAE